MRELVVSTLQDVRALAVELRPAALDDFGLVPAVERLAGTVREQSGLRIDFEAQLGDERLPTEVETALYRVVQEALTNIVKHADARHVSILLARKKGPSWPWSRTTARASTRRRTSEDALGLAGMRERMGLVGGRLRVESASGAEPHWWPRCPSVTIRVLVVDDHAVVRAGLRRVLDAEDDIETVGEAADAERAVFEAIETEPDVVLMDVVMPGKSGIEGMPALLQARPETKVLVLSMQDDPRYVQRGVRGRARAGTCSRRRPTPRWSAPSGPSPRASATSTPRSARGSSRRRPTSGAGPSRTRSPSGSARCCACSRSGTRTRRSRRCSSSRCGTAETHRAHIMQKLHLGSRAELVRYALSAGLLDS